jgi:multidrug efflux pump subunit AcrB
LPVEPLPSVDVPVIAVSAVMPGASPETMSTSVATPLERHLGVIADVDEMTSTSSVGTTRITLQFTSSRNIDGAARDVQAAINAARADLPAALRSNPSYRKFNPADQPILILSLTSASLTPGQIYDSASNILQQKLSTVDGIGQVQISGGSLPAVRVELNPRALFKYGIGLEDARAALSAANANAPKGAIEDGARRHGDTGRTVSLADHRLSQRRRREALRRSRSLRRCGGRAQHRHVEQQAGGARHPVPHAGRQHRADRRQREGGPARAAGGAAAVDQSRHRDRSHRHDP